MRRGVIALAVCAMAVGAVACDNSKITDINKNPNAPERVATGLLFANGLTGAIGGVRGGFEIYNFALWPQHLAEYQYPAASYYDVGGTQADAYWNAFYIGPLQDLEQARRQAVAANHVNEEGPILVMRAFTVQFMTRMWGDMPYSKANQADEGTISPEYDKQQDIYNSLLKDLADANAKMNATAGYELGAQDPIYGGNVTLWKKFANSLRARVALDLMKADVNKARTEIAAAVAAGGFTSNADMAQLVWPGDGTNDNPWFGNRKTRDDHRLSATLVDTLKSLNDPRLAIYAQPASGSGQFAGMPNGIEAGPAGTYGTTASRIGTKAYEQRQPSYAMTYAEYAFIKAEAAERGWISGSAAQFYADGVRASLAQWGVSSAAADAYMAQARVQYAGGAAGLQQIGLQKWLAFFTQGFEAWADWRRTGVPTLVPAVAARTNPKQIPRRFVYPQNEQSFNLSNLNAAISAQGGADLISKTWIDR